MEKKMTNFCAMIYDRKHGPLAFTNKKEWDFYVKIQEKESGEPVNPCFYATDTQRSNPKGYTIQIG